MYDAYMWCMQYQDYVRVTTFVWIFHFQLSVKHSSLKGRLQFPVSIENDSIPLHSPHTPSHGSSMNSCGPMNLRGQEGMLAKACLKICLSGWSSWSIVRKMNLIYLHLFLGIPIFPGLSSSSHASCMLCASCFRQLMWYPCS